MRKGLKTLTPMNRALATMLGTQFARNPTIEGAEHVAAELVELQKSIAGDVDSIRTMINYVTSAMEPAEAKRVRAIIRKKMKELLKTTA